MSKRLVLEKYCEDCPNFDPIVTNEVRYVGGYDVKSMERLECCDSEITCERIEICRHIANRIRRLSNSI